MTVEYDDTRLVAALRAGDEQAFRALIDRYQASFVRVAQSYVRDQAVAEEVAQETWVAILQGLDRFEGRSSLKTWMYRILTNRAITRAKRERRSTPFSSLAGDDGPAVDPDRFRPADDPNYPGHWRSRPQPWSDLPQDVLLAGGDPSEAAGGDRAPTRLTAAGDHLARRRGPVGR